MTYTVISIFFILLLAYLVLRAVYGFIRRDRKERIVFLREFKKGKCVAVYLIAIPLFFIGYDYVQESGTYAVFETISRTFNSVVNMIALKFEFMSVETLMKDNHFYGAAVISCNIICLFNTFVFVASLAQQFFWESSCLTRFNRKADAKYIIVGDNPGNRRIYKSIKKGRKILVAPNSNTVRGELYMDDIQNVALSDRIEFLTAQLERFAKTASKEGASNRLSIVINTEDDDEDLRISDELRTEIEKLFGDDPDLYLRLRIYVFASPLYEDIYFEAKTGAGCFRIIDKYEITAMEFAFDYPHALDLAGRIDKKTSLIGSDISINTIFLGFGDTNRDIFRHLCITDQFIGEENGELCGRPVNYHIFDTGNIQSDIILNHDLYRYRNEFLRYDEEKQDYVPAVDTADYLPLPSLPSKDVFHRMSIGSEAFYEELRKVLTSGRVNINRMIVAMGNDIENLDMARKLLAKVKDWDIKDTKIFAYQRHKDEGRMQSGIIAFGNENKNLYNMSELDDSMLVSFSINRNRIYALERARKYGSAESEEKIVKAADRSWFAEWPQAKRDSNLYASLSVRSKLLMMGLDFEKKKGGKSYLSYNEYMKLYAGDDLPEITGGAMKNGRGSAIRFSTNFKPSRAYNMAYQEHQRWNAYMMSRGIVPADKETILNETDDSGRHTNGNSYERRHHGNLTNFDGLREFAKMIAKRDNISEEKADVILYDYQLLDDAWWILDEMGYGIYEIA